MGTFLFKKAVDRSLLKDGTAIPQDRYQPVLDNLTTVLNKGSNHKITIIIDNVPYEATVNWLGVTNSDRNILQFRYSYGTPIAKKLREIFSHSDTLLSKLKDLPSNKGKQVVAPAADREFVEFYSLDKDHFEIRCFPMESKKAAFLKYLGGEDDLAGYQRSYKLVFLKVFLENFIGTGEIPSNTIADAFGKFYLDRKLSGLIPDVQVDPIIENIDTSSLQSILGVIIKNPFTAFRRHNFFSQITREGVDYFKIDDQLLSELTQEDIVYLKILVEKKLALYYSKISPVPEKRSWLLTWNPHNWDWEDYEDAVAKTKLGYPDVGSWSCISQQVMPGDRLYLIILGCQNNNGIVASGVATSCTYEADHWDEDRRSRGITAKYIDVSFETILDYKTEPILFQKDLINQFPEQHWSPQGSGIEIKPQYIAELEDAWQQLLQKNRNYGGEEELPTKDAIANIKTYIASKGFTYEDGLIEDFYLSLKSKPFVILAGTSGTGKTRLVRLFAEAVGATANNGRYKMVPVRPDWSDSSDLFGHVDLNGKFVSGTIIDFVKRAEMDLSRPYFLCLDEMNLARVEYYLSDILSVIETRDFQGGSIVSTPLVDVTYYGSDTAAAGRYGTVLLPENLYIIGTVNMDETTFPFSRKVLDRANTIEFSYVDLIPQQLDPTAAPAPMNLPNSFLKTEYLLLAQCADSQDEVGKYCEELQNINQVLQKANAHVGYRVRDEIVFYLLNNRKAELLDENDAMDNEIMQKILPRIQGSSASVKHMLCELFKICAGDYEGYQVENDDIASKMFKAAQNAKYKKSAEKIAFMVRRYEEDGFTSYWL